MTLVRRIPKGSPLTATEHDGNIDHLEADIVELQAASNLQTAQVSCIPTGGLSYLCRMDRYPIMGVNYSATSTTITLYDTSTIPSGEFRMDMIYGDTLGNISKRTGTPGVSAAPPDYDPTSEYVLKYILVASGATTGTDPNTGGTIDLLSIYEDAAVGNFTFNSLSAKITESTSGPISGTASISGVSTSSTDIFELTNSTALNVLDFSQLVLDCEATVAFWRVNFYNGATLVGSSFVDTTKFRLQDAIDPNKYTLGIPFSEFNFSAATFTKIQISSIDNNATWKLDNIRFTIGASVETDYTIPDGSVTLSQLSSEVLDLIPGLSINTFIGGIGTSINTKELLATTVGLTVADITNFSILKNNITCRILVDYAIPNSAFAGNTEITSFWDFEGKVTSMGSSCFNTDTVTYNFTHVYFPNLTAITGSTNFRNRRTMEVVYIPKCTALGNTETSPDQQNFNFGYTDFSQTKIYVDPFLATCDAGGYEGDLKNSGYGDIFPTFPVNFTKPDAITDLTVTESNGVIDLSWSAPISTNSLDFYEIWIDNKYYDKTTLTNFSISRLATLQAFTFEIRAVDIYYNYSNSNKVVGAVKEALNIAPSSATDIGLEGEIRYTADYIYVCISADTWKRTELTTW